MATSRKYHVSPHKPVSVRPSMGGKLMSNVSEDSAGIYNYVVKRDWRRVLDKEVRAEGYEYFWPNTSIAMGNQPFPNAPSTNEPITGIWEAVQPNGKIAIVCATPTTIFRFFALDNGAYYTGDGTADAYYLESGPNTPYYDDNPGVWLVVGSGFTPTAQRWEGESINGYLVLNNGVDLPVTYQVQDYAVVPIYELRESGIASVGNITSFDGILVCADISQINSDTLTTLLSIISSGTITASQTGAFGPTSQAATLVAGTVTAPNTTTYFGLGSIGKTVRFVNGVSGTITAFTNAYTVTVNNVTATVNPGLPFFIQSPGNTDFTVAASAPIFDATMVGRVMVWNNGDVRKITAYTDTQHVVVDSNGPIAAGLFGFKNPAAYAPFTDQSNIDRIQYRMIWSMPDLPRRWGASVPAKIAANSNVLTFQYPTMSFQSGQQVIVLGAGLNGGNLTANILFIAPNGMTAFLDTKAVTTVTGASVAAFDSIGSIVGFEDLQDDGSGIIGMKGLLGYLVVYKDTAIFLGQYTGVAGSAFTFDGNSAYRGSKSLYYRYTLVSIKSEGQEFHVYAGRNSFYRYDIVTRQPIEVQSGEMCKDLFFNNVDQALSTNVVPVGLTYSNPTGHFGIATFQVLAGATYYFQPGQNELQISVFVLDPVTNLPVVQVLTVAGQWTAATGIINLTCNFGVLDGSPVTAQITRLDNITAFAADNPITKEIFFCVPGAPGLDKAVRYDYFTGQVSTTSAIYTAAAAVKRPVAGIQSGPSEDWFVMGTQTGTLIRYGLTNTRPLASGTTTVTQAGNTLVASANFFAPDLVIGRSIRFPDKSVVNVTAYISPTQITVGGPATTRAATAFTIISASWHRLGAAYDSVIQSGLESFGHTFGETDLESIGIVPGSQSPGSSIFLEVLGASNPTDQGIVLGSKVLATPLVTNVVGMCFRQNYFQDRLTVSGLNNPFELVERVFNVAPVNSKDFGQR